MASLLSLLREKPQEQHFMVLDVETRLSAKEVGGWHRAADMGVSVAVLYDSAEHSYTAYTQDELGNLFARLSKANKVIGFNIKGFDYAVLQPFADYDLKTLPTLDLLVHIKSRLNFRVSLDNIASSTLGTTKSADGMQALIWWKEGKLAEITEYCKQDVDITRQIYLYGREHGQVFYSNKAGKKLGVLVNF